MSKHNAADTGKGHPEPEDERPDRRDQRESPPADSPSPPSEPAKLTPPPPGTGQGESPGKRVDD